MWAHSISKATESTKKAIDDFMRSPKATNRKLPLLTQSVGIFPGSTTAAHHHGTNASSQSGGQ
jgi:hypothetical protein